MAISTNLSFLLSLIVISLFIFKLTKYKTTGAITNKTAITYEDILSNSGKCYYVSKDTTLTISAFFNCGKSEKDGRCN